MPKAATKSSSLSRLGNHHFDHAVRQGLPGRGELCLLLRRLDGLQSVFELRLRLVVLEGIVPHPGILEHAVPLMLCLEDCLSSCPARGARSGVGGAPRWRYGVASRGGPCVAGCRRAQHWAEWGRGHPRLPGLQHRQSADASSLRIRKTWPEGHG